MPAAPAASGRALSCASYRAAQSQSSSGTTWQVSNGMAGQSKIGNTCKVIISARWGLCLAHLLLQAATHCPATCLPGEYPCKWFTGPQAETRWHTDGYISPSYMATYNHSLRGRPIMQAHFYS